MKMTQFKRQFLFSLTILIGLSFGLSACSNNEQAAPKYKTINTLNQQQTIETGTVVAVKNIQIETKPQNSYRNIGVAVGSNGFRGIHGAIDLATLGRFLSNTPNTKEAQEIIVKKKNGQTVVITQITKAKFKQGDNVKVLQHKGAFQVIH